MDNPFIKITNHKSEDYTSWVCTGEKPNVITVNTKEDTINLSLSSVIAALRANGFTVTAPKRK